MKTLYRSSDDKVFGGVCGALAHRFDLNVSGLRVAFFVAALFAGLAFWIYLVLWIVLKQRPTKDVVDVIIDV